ncbi:MAG: omptin family outer membrane protease [Spirochaetaceae bacterium]|nr:omptin family outer membrane protease [Spirochaetaceae bacterium]
MKNIPLFAFLVILFLYTPLPGIADTGAEAQDTPEEPVSGGYVWSLAYKNGVLWGNSRELVYHHAGSGDLKSRLDWELKPLVYFGMVLGVQSRERKTQGGFFSDIGLSTGFPLNSGTLEDRDWLNTEPGVLTHFSSHPSSTENALLLDYRLGLSLPAGYHSLFNLFLFFSWNHFRWTARDGYSQYPSELAAPYSPWNPDITKDYGSFRGKRVIRYTQDWMAAGLGLGLDFPLGKGLESGVSLLASPLVLVLDKDEHFLNKDTVFRDYLWGGVFLDASFFFAFSLSPKAWLLLKGSYRVITGSRGSTYVWQPADVFYGSSADTAGANISYASAELMFEWTFRDGP